MPQDTNVESLISENTHSLQRKAAIAWGKGTDHAGHVHVTPIKNFDLEKTIFSTLEGALPRMVIKAKIAKSVQWDDARASHIEKAFETASENAIIPPVDHKIITFMLDECDFSMEHADGTFLEHLLFCYDYSAIYFPKYSPNVALLHSILGTATNAFAMEANKIPELFKLLTEFEQTHIEAFPSILRLLNEFDFLDELWANKHRLDTLHSLDYHRVIDNKKCTIGGENLWIHLNYQLMHFVDFLPVANWANHSSDPVLQSFVRISEFLDGVNKRDAIVAFEMPDACGPFSSPKQETLSFGGHFSRFIPAGLKKTLAAKAIRKFSAKINHDLSYTLNWDTE